MALFKDQYAYRNFVREVLHKSRYTSSPQGKEFLKSFKTMVGQNEASIKKDRLLYRSQRDCEFRPLIDGSGEKIGEEPYPYKPERMKPLPNKAKEGRLNPKGIPYLYLNTDKETAIAESRPQLGQYVSLGWFVTQRDLRLVHFIQTRTSKKIIYFDKAHKEKIDQIVWDEINEAFSTPVVEDESTADYTPTQILAEQIRDEGWDGIVYRSEFGKGLNIALFDLGFTRLRECALYKVRKVKYKSEHTGATYYKK